VTLTIQQTGIYLDNERKIDVFFPPELLDSSQFACLKIDFAVLAYFEVKLAYATADDNTYKEQLMFRTKSLGEEFRSWMTTITPAMTEGQEFVVVLHSEGTSLGTMFMIQSINLLLQPCTATGNDVHFCYCM